MSTRRRLTLDDPTAAQPRPKPNPRPEDPEPPSAPAPAPAKPKTSDRPPALGAKPSNEPKPAQSGEWREWTGPRRVVSFRLADELIAELKQVTAQLGLPEGRTVTAAITYLLDQDDELIVELVDRADDALVRGKRRARRLGTRT